MKDKTDLGRRMELAAKHGDFSRARALLAMGAAIPSHTLYFAMSNPSGVNFALQLISPPYSRLTGSPDETKLDFLSLSKDEVLSLAIINLLTGKVSIKKGAEAVRLNAHLALRNFISTNQGKAATKLVQLGAPVDNLAAMEVVKLKDMVFRDALRQADA